MPTSIKDTRIFICPSRRCLIAGCWCAFVSHGITWHITRLLFVAIAVCVNAKELDSKFIWLQMKTHHLFLAITRAPWIMVHDNAGGGQCDINIIKDVVVDKCTLQCNCIISFDCVRSSCWSNIIVFIPALSELNTRARDVIYIYHCLTSPLDTFVFHCGLYVCLSVWFILLRYGMKMDKPSICIQTSSLWGYLLPTSPRAPTSNSQTTYSLDLSLISRSSITQQLILFERSILLDYRIRMQINTYPAHTQKSLALCHVFAICWFDIRLCVSCRVCL